MELTWVTMRSGSEREQRHRDIEGEQKRSPCEDWKRVATGVGDLAAKK